MPGLTVLGTWESKVRVLAGWFADDQLLPVPLHSVFSLCVQLSLFYEPVLVGQTVSPKTVFGNSPFKKVMDLK